MHESISKSILTLLLAGILFTKIHTLGTELKEAEKAHRYGYISQTSSVVDGHRKVLQEFLTRTEYRKREFEDNPGETLNIIDLEDRRMDARPRNNN